MRPFDALHKLTPAAAAQRIGGERVTLLSLRQILAGLGPRGAVLLTAATESAAMLPPLLRATRASDAILGLAPSGALAARRRRHAFFAEVVEAALAVTCNRPLVLVAPPLALEVAGEADLYAEQAWEWIEAGYTHVPIDVSALDPAEAPATIARAAAPILEHELGLEVLIAPGQEDEAGEICGALRVLGVEVDLLGVRGGGGVGMAVVASDIDPVAVSWWEGDEVEDFRSGLRNAVGAGARSVCLRSPFSRALVGAAPSTLGESTRPLEQVTKALSAGALDERDRDRIEIAILGESEDLLRLLRLRGAAPEVARHLLAAE